MRMYALALLFVFTTGLQAMAAIASYTPVSSEVVVETGEGAATVASELAASVAVSNENPMKCCDRAEKATTTGGCSLDCKVLASAMSFFFKRAVDQPQFLDETRTYIVSEKVNLRPPNG